MSNYAVWIWLAVFVILTLTEIATVQLTTIWFAAGALVSMIISACGVNNIAVQIIVFLLVSLISLIATRPLVKKIINRKTIPTNSDRCIGAEALVTEEINNKLATGAVQINGIIWTARSENNVIIPKDTTVVIKRIEGVKAIVE